MSNTIKTPRRRPRVKSVNFRALWWCVQREAVVNVLRQAAVLSNVDECREYVLLHRTYFLRRWMVDTLRRHPEWRYYP